MKRHEKEDMKRKRHAKEDMKWDMKIEHHININQSPSFTDSFIASMY